MDILALLHKIGGSLEQGIGALVVCQQAQVDNNPSPGGNAQARFASLQGLPLIVAWRVESFYIDAIRNCVHLFRAAPKILDQQLFGIV